MNPCRSVSVQPPSSPHANCARADLTVGPTKHCLRAYVRACRPTNGGNTGTAGRVLSVDEIDVVEILRRQKEKVDHVQTELKESKARLKNLQAAIASAKTELAAGRDDVLRAAADGARDAKPRLKAQLGAELDEVVQALRNANTAHAEQMRRLCKRIPDDAQQLNLLQVLCSEFLTTPEFDDLASLRDASQQGSAYRVPALKPTKSVCCSFRSPHYTVWFARPPGSLKASQPHPLI